MIASDRMSLFTPWFCLLGCVVLGVAACPAMGQAQSVKRSVFKATDTQRDWSDNKPEAQALLEQVRWEPGEFEVRCESTPGLTYDALVRFDSPKPSGQRWVDRVVMTWYAARDENGNAIEAPAVLLVHSLHPQMLLANQLALDFAEHDLHAFVIQLPGYGQRWSGDRRFPAVTTLEHGSQAIADCLRARDAILALPNVKQDHVALQGTSLGGYVAATVGGIEPDFQPVLLLISGGDGYGTLINGEHDARQLRITLERFGHTGEALRRLLEPVEPLTVAHRLDPDKTWMITARDDMTIPRANSDALAQAIGLPEAHRIWLGTNHYTTLLMFPAVSRHMAQTVRGELPDPITSEPGPGVGASGNGDTQPPADDAP